MDTIMSIRDVQPFWLRWRFDSWISLQHPAVTFFWILVAASETIIALALITGFARKATYVAVIAFSLLIWSTAEGFSGLYTSGSSDIGTAIVYAVVFAGLLALSYYAGTSRYTADYYLEKKISWWWRLAEVRRPEAPAPVMPAPRARSRRGRYPSPPRRPMTCRPGTPPPSQRLAHARSGMSTEETEIT